MKLIVRADDYGYTDVNNLGVLKAVDDGIVTSVDIMLDTPGTLDALERIKNYPHISVGWHAHFWGSPVLDPSLVPSMVNADGKFKFRHDMSLKKTCKYEEVYKESKAQIERCIFILGKAPDTAWIQNDGSEFERARKQICKEYGIAINIASKPNKEGIIVPADEKYLPLDIYMPNQPSTVYKICYSEQYSERMKYDPVKYYTEDEADLLKRNIVLTAWHPGYLDDYIFSESSMGECRVMDIKALCNDELKAWIKGNKVELINHRDAIYGTNEYQNYLKHIGSDLYIRKE